MLVHRLAMGEMRVVDFPTSSCVVVYRPYLPVSLNV